ncbi:MAG: hypothetical protein HYU84_15950 [Chloroflexi bacterium]|nr:hypothetical protein [Chloroflexota bacterium]MBI3170268.1 hypothetical protein [Chloroflexota bacterium]
MQLFFRVKQQPEPVVPNLGRITLSLLEGDPSTPFTLKQINDLPENIKQRVYRNLIPPLLLTRFDIDPITWCGANKEQRVFLTADSSSEKVFISARTSPSEEDEFFVLELADNMLNGIDLNLLLLNDPASARFNTDKDEQGNPTMFGTVRRNLTEETRAKEAGLAPGQVRNSLSASKLVLDQIDTFLATIGQRAYFLEPLTYASAWVFEKRGFAYVRGHKLMATIHQEFQPGGTLHKALDGSSPFRQQPQWDNVRGRAWAIHDGILDVLETNWDKLRMVKQVGRHAGASTFPSAIY